MRCPVRRSRKGNALSRGSGPLTQRQSTDLSLTPAHLSQSRYVSIYRSQLNHHNAGTEPTTQVLEGQAEVFGAELAKGKHYLFGSECKAAIFTWQGCIIEMSIYDSFAVASYPYRLHTSLVILQQNMFRKRHLWQRMPIYTLLLNKCESVR